LKDNFGSLGQDWDDSTRKKNIEFHRGNEEDFSWTDDDYPSEEDDVDECFDPHSS